MPDANRSLFTLPVLSAEHLRAESGANTGDTMSIADELVLDDTYHLVGQPMTQRLSLRPDASGTFTITQSSAIGTPGATVCLDSCLTWMSPDGKTTEMLVLVVLDSEGMIADLIVMPLSELTAKTDYRLVGIDTDGARAKLAQVACVSFTAGTHITLATGEQRLVQDLTPGDTVLTRDDGPQELRWVGHSTQRAVGEFAPIRIAAGTLHNSGDLIVSPDHRLFIYQRSDELGLGRSEVMVRARHMVNGHSITRLDGGFVDYYQLLFDAHQIIYAEGIAAETLLLDDRTQPALPRDRATQLMAETLAHTSDHADLELADPGQDSAGLADLLRRASTG
ncbi:MAG: Hint domain-containing protein [Thalassovita sp.]